MPLSNRFRELITSPVILSYLLTAGLIVILIVFRSRIPGLSNILKNLTWFQLASLGSVWWIIASSIMTWIFFYAKVPLDPTHAKRDSTLTSILLLVLPTIFLVLLTLLLWQFLVDVKIHLMFVIFQAVVYVAADRIILRAFKMSAEDENRTVDDRKKYATAAQTYSTVLWRIDVPVLLSLITLGMVSLFLPLAESEKFIAGAIAFQVLLDNFATAEEEFRLEKLLALPKT